MAEPIGSKPGWKTTEFWMTVITVLSSLIGSFGGAIPPKITAIIGASLTGLYGVVRAYTKSNVGDSQPTNPINAKPTPINK